MKIKQTYLNEGNKVINIDHDAIDILADDGRELFSIHQKPDGSIEVSASSTIKHGGAILENLISIEPRCSNVVTIRRREYKK